MRDAIVARGVAADRVDLEDESSDTVGSAVLVAVRYLRDRPPCPLHVITSPFHLERATETFRHVLGFAWQIQAVAADETEDDVLRAAAETVYLKETAALFAGLKPGDLRAIARRLRERSPEYARLDRLALS